MFSEKQEFIGTIFILLAAMTWGAYPVVANVAVKFMPPLFFVGWSIFIASLFLLIYLIKQNKLSELKNKKVYFNLLMVTVCVVIIPQILFFIGVTKTSAVNASVLLLSELIFVLIFTPFIGENNTLYKYLGALGILVGSFFIMYKGRVGLNIGDVLIFFSTITYPMGNFFAKKSLNAVSPATVLFVRFLLGGIFIILFSFYFERSFQFLGLLIDHWKIFLLNGLVIFALSKMFFYEAMKRLDISKCVSLGLTFPLFSVLILFGMGQVISFRQFVGIAIMAVGVYFSIKRKSVDINTTKYASV